MFVNFNICLKIGYFSSKFILTLRHNGETIYQNVLSPKKKANDGILSSWKWGFPASSGTYHALYPTSWTVYDISEHQIRLICKQLSPFIPGDYKVFEFCHLSLNNIMIIFNYTFNHFYYYCYYCYYYHNLCHHQLSTAKCWPK